MAVSICPADHLLLRHATGPAAAARPCHARPWCGPRKNGPHERQTRRAGGVERSRPRPPIWRVIEKHGNPNTIQQQTVHGGTDVPQYVLLCCCTWWVGRWVGLMGCYTCCCCSTAAHGGRGWVGRWLTPFLFVHWWCCSVVAHGRRHYYGTFSFCYCNGPADEVFLSTGAAAYH